MLGETSKQVAQVIIEHPGLSLQELAEALGMRPSRVYYHARRLVEAGYVRSRSRTRYLGLTARPALYTLLGLKRTHEPHGHPNSGPA